MMQKNNTSNQVNLVDLFFYLLAHWYWFVLCAAVCVGYAYYRYAKMPMVYRSDATVIIKDPSNTRSTVHMDNYSSLINHVSMSNEMLQLRSVQLMSEVVRTLDADISYTVHERLRDIELYDRTPLRMEILREDGIPEYLQVKATPLTSLSVRYTVSGNDSMRVAQLGDTLNVNGIRLIFKPTASYTEYMNKEKGITITKYPIYQAATDYLSKLKVSQAESDGTILQLSLQDYSLLRADDILNTLVEKYNEDAIREKRRIAVNTAVFINERLGIIQDELGEVEENLAQFKSSEKIMDVNETASQYLGESRGYGNEIIHVETRLRLAQYLKDYLSSAFRSYETIPVNIGLDDPGIITSINHYNDVILQHSELIRGSSEGSPAVQQIESSLIPIEQGIVAAVDNLITSLEQHRAELSRREQESIRKFTAMPAKARKLLSIERQQKIKESLYIFLLNKREENALTRAMADNNARMIDAAKGSSIPIYPNRNKMLLMAFLIGLFIPALILISRLFIDTKLRSRADIDAAGDIPFLADIPETKHKKKKAQKGQPAMVEAEYGHASKVFDEAMRMMCTNLDFSKPESIRCPVIMTTSFNVAAGKSFITRNVAACLVDAHKKVIVIDVDLRKRSISKFFGFGHHTTGLSNYLVDKEMEISGILRTNLLEGIDFIPAGHIPPNPTEILSRERFSSLLETLRTRYDYILLDGTPFNMVADSMVIAPKVDMTLFVVRSGVSDKRQLPMLDELCRKGQLPHISVVLNSTNVRKMYGYAYGYGYGYDSGYYGSKGD